MSTAVCTHLSEASEKCEITKNTISEISEVQKTTEAQL